MKRILAIMLSIVCALGMCLSLTACADKELQFDKEYVYLDISFKKAKGITLDDISSFVPFMLPNGSKVESVKDFEKMLRDYIDKYAIERHTPNGNEKIYLKTNIASLRITEGYPYVENAYSLWIKYENETNEMRFGMIRNGNTFTCIDEEAKIQEVYFSDGMLHYDLEFNDKFSVVYDYKLSR